MEKKEEKPPADRQKMIASLREMTEVSLSHMPQDDYEEALKLLKAFFGEYFEIPYEYTFSELQQRVLESNEGEEIKERIIELTNTIDKIFYTEENPDLDSFNKIRDDFLQILGTLVPEGINSNYKKSQKKFQFFGFLNQKKQEPKNKNNAIQERAAKKEIPLPEKAIFAAPIKTAVDKIKPQPAELSIKKNKPEANIVKKPLLDKASAKETIKPDLKPSKEIISIPKKPDMAAEDSLEDEINHISNELQKISQKGAANPFLQLELKSLMGDFKLFRASKSQQSRERISNKINNIKSRMPQTPG